MSPTIVNLRKTVKALGPPKQAGVTSVANQHNTACHQPQAVHNPRNGDSPSPSDSFNPFDTTARDPVPRPYQVTTSLSGTANTESEDLCDANPTTRFALNARTRDGHRCNDEPNADVPRTITEGAPVTPVLRDCEYIVDSVLQHRTEGDDIDDRGDVWDAQTARNAQEIVNWLVSLLLNAWRTVSPRDEMR